MKPVLVNEHENEALSFIRDVESQYLPLVKNVIAEIKTLGLTPTESTIRAVLMDGPEVIRGNYQTYAGRDINPRSTPHVQQHMKNIHANVFSEFVARVKPRLEATIGERSVRNPLFQELIAFDETGMPYLSQEARTRVMDQYKEYVSNPATLKLHNALAGAATSLQALWQALQASGMAAGLRIDYSDSDEQGWVFERHVLRVLTDHLTITGCGGKYLIEPRQLNYKNINTITAENDGE
jgi:hypothetical protein